MPWNFSFTALENFIINSKYCKSDLGEVDNKAQILTQFSDYVLVENASKWRDSEPFLSSGELKNTWNAFFSARPQSAFTKTEASKQSAPLAQKKFNRPNVGFKKLPFIDVCYNWNKGTCNKQAGCASLHVAPAPSCVRSPHGPEQLVSALRTESQEAGSPSLNTESELD